VEKDGALAYPKEKKREFITLTGMLEKGRINGQWNHSHCKSGQSSGT
jgi:hypothetical protein